MTFDFDALLWLMGRPTWLAAMGSGDVTALLEEEGVCVLAGDAFGGGAAGHVRISLTAPDERLAEACNRIGRLAFRLVAPAAPRRASA